MASPKHVPPILRMRDSIIELGQSAKAEDKRAGLQAAKVCWEAAKEFFADDPISKSSFRERLEGILSELKEENYDEAFQSAYEVLEKIQQLCMLLAGAGQLPELIEELGQVRNQMTRFDYYVGRLCEATYGKEDTPENTIAYGMLQTLVFAFRGNFSGEDTRMSLLEGKASQSKESAQENKNCEQLVEAFLSDEFWAQIKSDARKGKVPVLLEFISYATGSYQQKYPLPPGKVVRGYYSLIADFSFRVGLLFAIRKPGLASNLLIEVETNSAKGYFDIEI